MEANNHYKTEWWVYKQGGVSPDWHQGSARTPELCGTSEMTYPGMLFTSKDIKFRETDPMQ